MGLIAGRRAVGGPDHGRAFRERVMTASDYADQYLHLKAQLYDGSVVEVPIDRYLNARITGKKDDPKPMNYRANRAEAEKDALFGEIKRELKIHGHMPDQFTVDGYGFKMLDVYRPFVGKGSPSNLLDVFWLASKYKRVTAGTAREYAANYLGLDCNGFAGNLWGINPSTGIAEYDVNPRTEFLDVSDGDALVFYWRGTRSNPFHIAVIDFVHEVGKTRPLRFDITQSDGVNDKGVHTDFLEWKLTKDARGHVVREEGNWVAHVVEGPPKGKPRGLEWAVSTS